MSKSALARKMDHTPGYEVKVTNIFTGEIVMYSSLRIAGAAIGVHRAVLAKHSGNILGGIYHIFIDRSTLCVNTRDPSKHLKKTWSKGYSKRAIITKIEKDLAISELSFVPHTLFL
jgi:hypothetical protein